MGKCLAASSRARDTGTLYSHVLLSSIEGAFTVWADRLYKHLLEQFPAPNGLEPIPDDVILPPRWTLSPALNKIRNQKSPGVVPALETPSHSDPPPSRLLPVPDGRDARLVEMKRMTPESHWQDVRLVGFDIPSPSSAERLQCNPGDCLTIYPKNFPDDVQRLIILMEWESVADEPLDLTTCGPLPRGLYAPEPCTIRNLLLENIDISSIPRRSFLKSMSYFATNQDQKERLLEFTNSEFLDEYFDYATRSRRTIIEVLDEFTSVKLPADRLLDIFPLIHGRDFSIATGGDLQFKQSKGEESVSNGTNSHPTTRVELLIALVRYRTILRKPREGLCSRYVASLPLNSVIRVSHKRVLTPIHGPDNVQRPLVAIATGTGIAPIRSLIYERLTHPNPAPMLLFFGNRNRKADYFFEDEWERLASTGALSVMTAFSRDQEGKVYVQHVLRNQASQLGELIPQGAIFSVCGGSSKMADACKEAVFDPFKEGGDKDDRQKILDSLTWWQEIW